MAAYVKIGKALPIGIVVALTGYVLLTGTDGLKRLLHQGEPIHSDDQLSTGPDSSLTIGFADGSDLNLGANSSVTIDNQVFDPASFGGGEAGSVATSLEALQQAILAGADPSNIEDSDGGHGTVRLSGPDGLAGGDVLPHSGTDATGSAAGETLASCVFRRR